MDHLENKKRQKNNTKKEVLVEMQRGYCLDDLDDFPEAEFDQQTQARLDAAVDRLLKGYNWTLQPLANK